MEQTISLFCTCDSGVARCHTQSQRHLCSKRIARASELGSCQSSLFHSYGYERLQKSKDSLKACFEFINIVGMFNLDLRRIDHIGEMILSRYKQSFC